MNLFRNKEFKIIYLIFITLSTILCLIGLRVSFVCFLLMTIQTIAIIILFLILNYYKYRNMSKLSEKIDRILHDTENIVFDKCNEGELAVLENEVAKMTNKIKLQNELLKEDKLYLVNALANISHQIRTPLTTINLILTMLSKSDLDPNKRREYIFELSSMINHIEWLITTLLKLSKLDSKTAYFNKTDVNIKKVFTDIKESFEVYLDINNVNLILNIDDNISFVGDYDWSKEAFYNIIKNCIEHTSSNGGNIAVNVSDNPINTIIEIIDDGTGISEEDLPNIFNRFYKGKNSNAKSYGIGLSLTKEILEKQNTTINVKNNRDIGCKFEIRIYKKHFNR